MKQYTWEQTLGVERKGEIVLDAVFGREYIVVRATRDHQRQKIDRFHINKKDGRVIYRVDYKVEEAAARWGNLALEHVSVFQNGVKMANGWVHDTIADYTISYVPQWDTAFVVSIIKVRTAWKEIERLWPLKPTSTKSDDGMVYITKSYMTPIEWLKDNRIIEREIRAIGAQSRLPIAQ